MEIKPEVSFSDKDGDTITIGFYINSINKKKYVMIETVGNGIHEDESNWVVLYREEAERLYNQIKEFFEEQEDD